MNKTPRAFLMAALAALLPLAACSDAPGVPADQSSDPASEKPPLAGARIGGDFHLTDQNGKPFDSASLEGQYRILYFGYTFCPDVCPIDLQKLMAGFRLYEKAHADKAKTIQPIFITIDPERDTPEVLKQYVSAFHPRLIGLTGSLEEIRDVADDYLIVFNKQKAEGMSEYLVDHSRQAYLFGPQGEPVALLPYDGTPQEIADEIERWTR